MICSYLSDVAFIFIHCQENIACAVLSIQLHVCNYFKLKKKKSVTVIISVKTDYATVAKDDSTPAVSRCSQLPSLSWTMFRNRYVNGKG